MKIQVNRLNHLIEFGTFKAVNTGTLEGTRKSFVPQQTVHCAYYQRSLSQQYQLLGTSLEGTIVVAVRSQANVHDQTQARLDGSIYDVVMISRDDSHSLTRFDLVTLKLIKKVGS